jgi:hypothetical protein
MHQYALWCIHITYKYLNTLCYYMNSPHPCRIRGQALRTRQTEVVLSAAAQHGEAASFLTQESSLWSELEVTWIIFASCDGQLCQPGRSHKHSISETSFKTREFYILNPQTFMKLLKVHPDTAPRGPARKLSPPGVSGRTLCSCGRQNFMLACPVVSGLKNAMELCRLTLDCAANPEAVKAQGTNSSGKARP